MGWSPKSSEHTLKREYLALFLLMKTLLAQVRIELSLVIQLMKTAMIMTALANTHPLCQAPV